MLILADAVKDWLNFHTCDTDFFCCKKFKSIPSFIKIIWFDLPYYKLENEVKLHFSTQLRKTRPKILVFSQTVVTKKFILTSKLDYKSRCKLFSLVNYNSTFQSNFSERKIANSAEIKPTCLLHMYAISAGIRPQCFSVMYFPQGSDHSVLV